MSKELQAQTFTTTGSVYARLWNVTDQYWYTVTPAFEAYNAAHITSYRLTGTQDGSTGKWTADMPAAVTVGKYYYCFYSGSGAEADLPISTVGNIDYTGTVASAAISYLPQAQAGAANGVFIAGTNAATVVTGSFTTTFTGNLTGSVGSVTGAVGSVTGNVGGNVTGSVGSVVGAVGSVTGAVGSVTGNVGGNVVGTVASVTGNVGGNVTGSVGSVVGAVGSVAGNVGGNVVGSVASVVADVGITQAGADKVWASASRTLTAFGFTVAATVSGTVNANVVQVNSITVHGSGTAVDPWGP